VGSSRRFPANCRNNRRDEWYQSRSPIVRHISDECASPVARSLARSRWRSNSRSNSGRHFQPKRNGNRRHNRNRKSKPSPLPGGARRVTRTYYRGGREGGGGLRGLSLSRDLWPNASPICTPYFRDSLISRRAAERRREAGEEEAAKPRGEPLTRCRGPRRTSPGTCRVLPRNSVINLGLRREWLPARPARSFNGSFSRAREYASTFAAGVYVCGFRSTDAAPPRHRLWLFPNLRPPSLAFALSLFLSRFPSHEKFSRSPRSLPLSSLSPLARPRKFPTHLVRTLMQKLAAP